MKSLYIMIKSERLHSKNKTQQFSSESGDRVFQEIQKYPDSPEGKTLFGHAFYLSEYSWYSKIITKAWAWAPNLRRGGHQQSEI